MTFITDGSPSLGNDLYFKIIEKVNDALNSKKWDDAYGKYWSNRRDHRDNNRERNEKNT